MPCILKSMRKEKIEEYKEISERWEDYLLQTKEHFALNILSQARDDFPDGLAISSSFGTYSAVMLDLSNRANLLPNVPVISVRLKEETPETRKHREELTEKFGLDLRLYEEEAYGTHERKQDKKGTFERALEDLNIKALVSGLRRDTQHRENFEIFMYDDSNGIYRVHPLLSWNENDMNRYLRRKGLPINPNHKDEYKELSEKKECGIHLFSGNGEGV